MGRVKNGCNQADRWVFRETALLPALGASRGVFLRPPHLHARCLSSSSSPSCFRSVRPSFRACAFSSNPGGCRPKTMPFGAGASVGVAFPVPLSALRVLIMAICDRLRGAVVCHFRGGPLDVPKFLRFPPLPPPPPFRPLSGSAAWSSITPLPPPRPYISFWRVTRIHGGVPACFAGHFLAPARLAVRSRGAGGGGAGGRRKKPAAAPAAGPPAGPLVLIFLSRR